MIIGIVRFRRWWVALAWRRGRRAVFRKTLIFKRKKIKGKKPETKKYTQKWWANYI